MNFVPALANNFKVNNYTRRTLKKDSNTNTVSSTRVTVWAGLDRMDKLPGFLSGFCVQLRF